MNSTDFQKYLDDLVETLKVDSGVVGLITLGTTADPAARDEWSDHDFWIVMEPGAGERYLSGYDWLPQSEEILLTARHGRSYRGVLYRNGHSAEFAVFDREAALGGTIERYRVLIDRGGIVELAESIRLRSLKDRAASLTAPDKFENFCMKIWTICERSKRGETLSARRYTQLATDTLLDLLIANGSLNPASFSDGLEPRRRLEHTNPDLAKELEWIAMLPGPSAAAALIQLVEDQLKDQSPQLAWNKLSTIKEWIEG